ncbi:hypothetical protein PIB30_050465 [Stylosanthes scabra]|uniref:DUF4283 domain-containing protein n=1 Tax=Stylosanthes scabra TaxID=79078 RepID=A0ABU6VJL5_9FABA|nr:hypothetical protein [Stylosanthes scabra]
MEDYHLAQEMEESEEDTVITINNSESKYFKPHCYNLVGKVITHKVMNFKALKTALQGIWGNPDGFSILEIGTNGIIASFKDRGRDGILGANASGPVGKDEQLLSKEDRKRNQSSHRFGGPHYGACSSEILPESKNNYQSGKNAIRKWQSQPLIPRKSRYVPRLGVDQARSQLSIHGRKWKRKNNTVAGEEEDEAHGKQDFSEGVGTDNNLQNEGAGERRMGWIDSERDDILGTRDKPYQREGKKSEQVGKSAQLHQIKARFSGLTTDLIEEVIEKTIQNLTKGEGKAVEGEFGPGPLEQGGKLDRKKSDGR